MAASIARRPFGATLLVIFLRARSLLLTRCYELLAFAVPFSIFALSTNHDVSSWDTAEMQGVPYILGITHPTGFPAYILAGYVFSHLVAIGTVAFRLNIFSALCVSVACVTLYSTAREMDIPRVCALAAAWWFPVVAIVWNHAIRAEVHDLALLLIAISILCWLRWLKSSATVWFLSAAAALGLALATHPIAIWLLPGVALTLAFRAPAARLAARGFAVLIACLALYAYLPIRSFLIVHGQLDPTVGLAGQQGGLFWNLNDPSTWHGFVQEVSGSQFGAGHTVLSAVNATVIQSYLWSWLTTVNQSYGAFGIVLAFIGLACLWSRNWRTTSCLLVFCLALVPFSYAYGNVEGDSDRYRMLSLWLVPILMAGAALSRRVDGGAMRVLRTSAVFGLMCLWGFETFLNNRGIMTNANGIGNHALITEAAARMPRGAIVLTPWTDATTLAYGAYVEGELQDRIVIAGWPNEEEKHFSSWLKQRPIYVIWNQKPDDYPGVRFVSEQPLDANHLLWRVKPERSGYSFGGKARAALTFAR